jgi:HlyD family secretion protein
MDVKRPRSKIQWKKRLLFGSISVGFIFFVGVQFELLGSKIKISGQQLLYANVRQGDLSISVEGYGKLHSSQKKLLTALTDATIDEIFLKPGAIVSEGSLILRMNNPELMQSAASALQVVVQERANFKKMNLNQKRDLLSEQSRAAELKASLIVAEMKLEAEELLFKKGIVSKLQFKQSEVKVAQLDEQLRIQASRFEQLGLVHQEALNVQQEVIKQAERQRQNQLTRIQALDIRAGIPGVLQQLSVELGQSVKAGQELVLIGSTDKLEAYIRVSQTQAEDIRIGQLATIDARSDKMLGKVSRIDPTVVDGTVLIEVSLDMPIAASARPGLSVDGVIEVGELSDILYIERPVNARENESTVLYRLIDNKQTALATPIRFGDDVGKFIQILSGAKVGDTFILSDLSRYQPQEIVIQ